MRLAMIILLGISIINFMCNIAFYYNSKATLVVLKSLEGDVGTIQIQTAAGYDVYHIAPKLVKSDYNIVPGGKTK